MEILKNNLKNITYWTYMAMIGFMVFVVAYHGLGIAIKVFIPLVIIVVCSHIFDFPKALVIATIAASIISLNFISIHLVSKYFFQMGIADIIVFLQIILLIIYRTVYPAKYHTRDIFVWPVALFILAAIISVFVAFDKFMSVTYILLLINGYLFYRFIMFSFQEEDSVRVLTGVLILALSLTVLWAFVNRSLVPATTRAGIFLETRAGYLFAGPNGLAAILVILMPFCFIALSFRSNVVRVFLAAIFVGAFLLLLETYSRNGYLSFLVSTVLIIVLFLRRKSVYSIPIIIIIGIPLIVSGAAFIPRLFSISMFRVDPSALFRLIMWKIALNEFIKYPFTGIGIVNFYYATKLYHSGFCHNTYLNAFTETGVLGGVAVLWFAGTVYYKLIQTFRSLKDGFLKNLNICLLGSWTAFFFNNIFDQVTFYVDRTSEMKLFWLLVALTAVFVLKSNKLMTLRNSG